MDDKNTKLTLEALIAKAEQRKADKLEFKDAYVEELGGCLTLKKIPLSRYLSMMDSQEDDSSTASMAFEAQLIYTACPTLHSKELQEAYGCQEPTDIVFHLLNDNIPAVNELAASVLDFYGVGDQMRDRLKN